jgi:hypothetical protein
MLEGCRVMLRRADDVMALSLHQGFTVYMLFLVQSVDQSCARAVSLLAVGITSTIRMQPVN